MPGEFRPLPDGESVFTVSSSLSRSSLTRSRSRVFSSSAFDLDFDFFLVKCELAPGLAIKYDDSLFDNATLGHSALELK
jgi:hypothetical protein